MPEQTPKHITKSMPSLERNPLAHYRRFESFKEYESLFDSMVPQTVSVIRVFDRVLPRTWNDSPRIALLRKFLLGNRNNKLMVILHLADNIGRESPRLVELAVHFSHAVKIRQTPKIAQHIYDPFVIFDASHYLHRFHYAHMRAAQGSHDVEGTQQLLDRYAELWEASAPVTLASPSGL
jgi:hypothetical protein